MGTILLSVGACCSGAGPAARAAACCARMPETRLAAWATMLSSGSYSFLTPNQHPMNSFAWLMNVLAMYSVRPRISASSLGCLMVALRRYSKRAYDCASCIASSDVRLGLLLLLLIMYWWVLVV